MKGGESMNNQNKNKENNGSKSNKTKNQVNSVAAGVAGAVVGAGIGTASAIVLGKKENRDKVMDVAQSVKNEAVKYVDQLDLSQVAKDATQSAKEEVAKSANSQAQSKSK